VLEVSVWIIERYLQKKAKRLGVKLSRTSIIASDTDLHIEAPASLGQIEFHEVSSGSILWGAHSYIRSGEIHCLERVGRFCSIGRNVILGQNRHNHPLDWVSTSHGLCSDHTAEAIPTSIGDDVWIGDGAVIFAGVTIGTGAVIARNAVVTKSVGNYEIVAGNPARCIRKRFDDDTVARMVASRWWEYPLEQLKLLDYKHPDSFLRELLPLDGNKAQYPRLRIGKGVVDLIDL
jgi:acetyltransferase-like isoleucine patch superfamily enzyme